MYVAGKTCDDLEMQECVAYDRQGFKRLDEFEYEPEPMPAGIYGLAITSFVRDLQGFSQDIPKTYVPLKAGRLACTSLMVFVAILLQGFLILSTKRLVTPLNVKQARQVYHRFEEVMYMDDAHEMHVYISSNGFSRGIDGYFKPENFELLAPKDKVDICRLPLSQPHLLFSVLYIWSLTCMSDLRSAAALSLRLLLGVPTTASMANALEFDEKSGTAVVTGLTLATKVVVGLFILLPRMFLTILLMWLGCRWLLATLGFCDLLLNAMALEFILMLRELLFNALVPHRLQQETLRTLVPQLFSRDWPSYTSYFAMYWIGFAAFLWVWLYMYHFQSVLPDYNFDVRSVCEVYLEEELRITN